MIGEESKKEKLRRSVNKELISLLNMHGEATALIARYRHNVSKKPGQDPFLFGHVLQILPEELHGHGPGIGYAEEAFYTALTLFAFAKNHGDGNIADAISRIAQNDGVLQRFRLAETSDNMDELRSRMRGIVSLIASKGESFNYVEFAVELYNWQFDSASQIRSWERRLSKR